MGLGGMLVIIGLVYFSGAGTWLWERTKELEGQCFTMLAQMGTTTGSGACSGVGAVVNGVDGLFNDTGGSLANLWESIKAPFIGTGIESAVGELQLTSALERLGSTKEQLAQRMRIGPDSLSSAGSVSEQIRSAVDSFSIGKNYLGGDGESAYRALPWLQKGAQVPGYGVLSQLSLGDIYRNGATSVSQNPSAAISYYSQAHQSIGLLQQSNTPEAQGMLKALPGSPQQVQQQLLAAIRDLQLKQ